MNSAVRRNYSNLSTNMNLARRFRYVDDAGVNVSSDPVALAALNQNAATYSWMSVTQGITMSDLIEDGFIPASEYADCGIYISATLVEPPRSQESASVLLR